MRSEIAPARRAACSCVRRFGHRRRRDVEVGELGQQQLDRLRIGALVHAVQRLASPGCQERADAFVGEDHELLHQHVSVRLAFEAGVGDAAVAVEAIDHLGRLHLQGPAREAPRAQLPRQHVVELEHLDDLGRCVTGLRLTVGQARVRADHRAVELRLAVGRNLDGHAEPVLVRTERAEVVGKLVREHRRNRARYVGRERPQRCTAVERRPGPDEIRDVGDVHPGANAVRLAPERERVVEVLRRVGVDRVREEVAQIDTVVQLRRGCVVGLERDARALLDQQRLEHVLDPRRRPERSLDPRPPAAGAHERELAGSDTAASLRLEHDRHARREVRLADQQPAATANFDDERRTGERRQGRGASVCQAGCPRARSRSRRESGTGPR